MMADEDERLALRKRIFDLKDRVTTSEHDARAMGDAVRLPLRNARNALFEAWTVLAVPFEETEEDH